MHPMFEFVIKFPQISRKKYIHDSLHYDSTTIDASENKHFNIDSNNNDQHPSIFTQQINLIYA